jgi:hypothetical protein
MFGLVFGAAALGIAAIALLMGNKRSGPPLYLPQGQGGVDQSQAQDRPNPAIFNVNNGLVEFKPEMGPPILNSLGAYYAVPHNGNANVVKLFPINTTDPRTVGSVPNGFNWSLWKANEGWVILASRLLAIPVTDPLNQRGDSLKSLLAVRREDVGQYASVGQYHAVLMFKPSAQPGQYVEPPPAATPPNMTPPSPFPNPNAPLPSPSNPPYVGPGTNINLPTIPYTAPTGPTIDDGFDASIPDELRDLANKAIDTGDPDRLEQVANELDKMGFKKSAVKLRDRAKAIRASGKIQDLLTRVVWKAREGDFPSTWANYAAGITGNACNWRDLISPENPTLRVVNVKNKTTGELIRTEVQANRNGRLESWAGTEVILPKSWRVPPGTPPPPVMTGSPQRQSAPPVATPVERPAAPTTPPDVTRPIASEQPVSTPITPPQTPGGGEGGAPGWWPGRDEQGGAPPNWNPFGAQNMRAAGGPLFTVARKL